MQVWHHVNRQEQFLAGGRKRWEKGGLKSLSATGQNRLQFGFSPDASAWVLIPLLVSILSAILESGLVMHHQCCLLFSHHRWHGGTGLYSEQLLQPSCTILHSGPVPQQVTVPTEINKGDLLPSLCISSVLQLLLVSLHPFCARPSSLKTQRGSYVGDMPWELKALGRGRMDEVG